MAYLEQFTGVARNTDTHFNTKTYLVDGCELQAGYADASITALTLTLSPQCAFDLAPFAISQQAEPIPAHTLTFGTFNNLFGDSVTYYADCLTHCGNAYDPATYALHEGPRATGFLEIMVSSTGPYESAHQWAQVMLEHEGDEWVDETQFNCNPYKYRDVARELYKDQPIEKITIGHELLDATECK
ncbi:hypothetical protein [Saezia sanguinis]|uniref:hypothetical protein n=1 Tax=Saezia sanguinis TaxID=1965230 RepID=UPI0011D0A8DC|nr:hypothetical protein [Saezia sanguinis]